MATLADMLADLNDRINDTGDSQVDKPTKVRYLNHGIRATWPRLYRTERDDSTILAVDTVEYAIPAAVGSNSKILRVERETADGSGIYSLLMNYSMVPGLTDPLIILDSAPSSAQIGGKLRVTAAVRLTALAVDADVYDGPAGTEELPVLYALGLVMQRGLDDRIDHRRYSTTGNANGVGPDQIMTASQFAFAQFELLLERFAMPLPTEELG